MAASIAAAARGAGGRAGGVTKVIGHGYLPGHAAFALDLLRDEPAVRRLFEARLDPAD